MAISIPDSTLEKFTTFGDLLRFLRRRVGLNQIEFAAAVGYSNTQISRLEQNLRLPDISMIQSHFVPTLGVEDEPKVVARLLDLAANVRREDAPGLGLCPYKGLNYFDESDADIFVGREALTANLVERVLSLASSGLAKQMRFLAVVGASGSGKSSLVRAGLVPALRWTQESADWHVHILTPTAHPLESLAGPLVSGSDSLTELTVLMDSFGRDPRSLQIFIKRQIDLENKTWVLLVVDQFEELFVLCRSEQERVSFIDNLLTAASEADGTVIVVITLRADYYASCANYVHLREALAHNQEYIGAMNDEELRRAIEEPARGGHWEIEPGLVDLLLHEVGHEPGALPLLSHALFETWQRRRGRVMTLSGYASSGGVRGAIAETAETVFADQFTNAQRSIARKIFLRLTELGDEASTADTRRRASFDELVLKPEEASTTHEVLKTLADARLITTTEDAAEVAHEALIREWPTLQGWLEENRESLRLHRQLTEAAQEWQKLDRTPDLLYRGARLAQAREWITTHRDEVNELEHEFLAASVAAREQEAAERDEGRRRELASAKELAETQRQSASRLQTRNRVITAVGFLTLILVILAGTFGLQSRNEKRFATARELSSAAVSNLEVDPELSIMLALQALDTAYTRESEDVLRQALQSSLVRMLLMGHDGGARSVQYSPNGTTIATTSEAGEVTVWKADSGQKLYSLPGRIARYSPDGSRLAIGGRDGTVLIWDIAAQSKLRTFEGHHDWIAEVAFSPDGKLLVSSSADNTIIVWDIETGQEKFSTKAMGYIYSVPHNVYFSPDGKLLIAHDTDGARVVTLVWTIDEWTKVNQFENHNPPRNVVMMDPDGQWLATTTTEDEYSFDLEYGITLWDFSMKDLMTSNPLFLESLVIRSAHKSEISNLAFSRDGSMLASSSQDGTAKVWHLSAEGPELLMTLSGHIGEVWGVSFSPDGNRLATAGQDGSVRIWDITQAGVAEWFTFDVPEDTYPLIVLTKDGRYLACMRVGDVIKIFELDTRKELLTVSDDKARLFPYALSPEGTLLVTAGFDNVVQVWELNLHSGKATAKLRFSPTGHTPTPVFRNQFTAVFTADSMQLATSGYDGIVRVWDTQTGKELLSFQAYPPRQGGSHLTFSPDGQLLATGDWAETVKVWDLNTTKQLYSFQPQPDGFGFTRLAFSPDGRFLAIANDQADAVVTIWEVSSGQMVSTLSRQIRQDAILGLVFSPDGNRLVTSSMQGSVTIWDVNTGDELIDLTGHTAQVEGIDFSSDGKYLVTSDQDGTARAWDTASGEELQVITNLDDGFFDVAFTPDGKRFIISGQRFVYGYVLDRDELIRLAHSRLTRWFTQEECRKYLHREACPKP